MIKDASPYVRKEDQIARNLTQSTASDMEIVSAPVGVPQLARFIRQQRQARIMARAVANEKAQARSAAGFD